MPDPKLPDVDQPDVDQLYDDAQRAYLEGDFAGALAGWSRALSLAPDDVEIKKKLVQTHFALGNGEAGEAALDTLRQAIADSADPVVQGWREVVIDQLQVGGQRVFAFEILRYDSADLYYVLVWRLLDGGGKVQMTVQVESSAYGREKGVPFVMGVNTARGHATTGPMFSSRPPYLALRELAVKLIEREQAARA